MDNILLDLQNSSYFTQPHSIIANYYQSLYFALSNWPIGLPPSKVYLIKKGTQEETQRKCPPEWKYFFKNFGFQEMVWTDEKGNLRK